MSTAFGTVFESAGKSGESSDGGGNSNPEIGTVRSEGNANSDHGVFGGLESFSNPADYSEPIAGNNARTESGNSSGEPRRTKTGRIDRRTKAGRNAQETPGSVETPIDRGRKSIKLISLEKAILSLHDMAAGLFEIPEIMLSEPEAKELSDAVRDLGQYYVETFDPRKVAAFNLVACMGGIYATRVMAYRHRMAQMRRENLRVMPSQPAAQPPAPGPNQADPVAMALNPPLEGAPGY